MLELISPNVTYVTPLATPRLPAYDCTIKDRVLIATPFGAMAANASQLVADHFDTYKNAGHLYDVGVTGLAYQQGVGSVRFCSWQRELASMVSRVVCDLGLLDVIDHNGQMYNFAGCSKYFRWMRYRDGGQHFPHYDSDFVFPHDPNFATLYTMIIYWSNCQSGELAFVNDKRVDHNNSDWDRQANEDEITLKIKPQVGKIVMFPHDMCHTVLPFTESGDRIITRGDLIFSKV